MSLEFVTTCVWRSSDSLITLIYWESLSSSSLLDVKSYSCLSLSLILRLMLDDHTSLSVIHHFQSYIIKSSYFWFIIFKNSSNFNHMTVTYAIIESCIQKTIDIINMCENSNQVEIACKFHVSYDRLQFRLQDYQFKTAVQKLRNKALKSDQKSALWQYLTTVNQLNLSARLHMMQSTINTLHA